MRDFIKAVAKIKVYDIYLTLGIDQGSNIIKVSNKICRCGFRFANSMLAVIKFVLQMV
jgi:hypothetical protein